MLRRTPRWRTTTDCWGIVVGEHTPESRMGIHPERGGAPATVSKGRSMTDTSEMVGGVPQREYIYNMIKEIKSLKSGYYRVLSLAQREPRTALVNRWVLRLALIAVRGRALRCKLTAVRLCFRVRANLFSEYVRVLGFERGTEACEWNGVAGMISGGGELVCEWGKTRERRSQYRRYRHRRQRRHRYNEISPYVVGESWTVGCTAILREARRGKGSGEVEEGSLRIRRSQYR